MKKRLSRIRQKVTTKISETKDKVSSMRSELKKRDKITAKTSWPRILSWCSYDLGNTVFSMNVVSLYLGIWIVNELGGLDKHYAYANAISMALIFMSAPFLGALSDQAKRRMPFLVVATVICVAFTALIGQSPTFLENLIQNLFNTSDASTKIYLAMLFFIVANYFYQAGLIFYDSLLPSISTESNRGRVGGLGVGLGYFGSLFGIASGILLLDRIGYTGMFQFSAFLFFIFALPCFLFVKESHTPSKLKKSMLSDAFREVLHTIENVKKFPGLGRFLIGRIFYTDAINTLIIFMSIYVTNEFGFTTDTTIWYKNIQYFLLVGVLSSIASGFLWGYIVDIFGPKRTLNLVLYLWFIDFTVVIALALFDVPYADIIIWSGAFLAGISVSGLWVADRPYMLLLTPPKYVGQFYGLYSMVGRFAAIIGPLFWGVIVNELHWGRPAAVGALFIFTIIAYLILQGVDDTPRDWPPEMQVDYVLEPPRGAMGRSR